MTNFSSRPAGLFREAAFALCAVGTIIGGLTAAHMWVDVLDNNPTLDKFGMASLATLGTVVAGVFTRNRYCACMDNHPHP